MIQETFGYRFTFQHTGLSGGSMKEQLYSLNEKTDKSIKNKIKDLVISSGTKYAVFPTLITTFGLVENTYSGTIQSLIILDDLFAP